MNQPKPHGPILLQGAMDVETNRLTGWLEKGREEEEGPWRFARGELEGHPVVVSRTHIGMANAAAATALALRRYRPRAVFNLGTTGGHCPQLHRGDILLGRRMIHLGAFVSPCRRPGEGSDPAGWEPLPTEGFRPGRGWEERPFLEGSPWLL